MRMPQLSAAVVLLPVFLVVAPDLHIIVHKPMAVVAGVLRRAAVVATGANAARAAFVAALVFGPVRTVAGSVVGG